MTATTILPPLSAAARHPLLPSWCSNMDGRRAADEVVQFGMPLDLNAVG
jgi:hypothetical protein